LQQYLMKADVFDGHIVILDILLRFKCGFKVHHLLIRTQYSNVVLWKQAMVTPWQVNDIFFAPDVNHQYTVCFLPSQVF